MAQAIRLHPLITRLKVSQESHIIGVYANDIIIWFTDPLQSLPPLCDLLEHFGHLSIYKQNNSKTAMMGISLTPHLKTTITKKSPFSWAPSLLMTYLGIHLTSPSAMLFHSNFTSLCQKLQAVSITLLTVKSSWAGCIALAKMFLLPLLCFLRTLPLPILHSSLSQLQLLLNQFILYIIIYYIVY